MTKEPSGTPGKASSGRAHTFSRTSRILRSAEFRHIYDHGFRVSHPLFAAFCFRRPDSDSQGTQPRLGLTVPRAVGKAVDRNRIKRRLREAFRLHCAGFNPRWDVVVNPRKAMLDAAFPEIERALGKVIERCNASS